MDPDKTLEGIRDLTKTIVKDYEDTEGNGVDQDDAASLASHCETLDEWMTKGGFSPKAWAAPQIYTCIYTHKHGVDVAAYRTEAGAYKVAWQLANDRVDESWDDEAEVAKFKVIDNAADALGYFHEVELEVAYGESFDISGSELGE